MNRQQNQLRLRAHDFRHDAVKGVKSLFDPDSGFFRTPVPVCDVFGGDADDGDFESGPFEELPCRGGSFVFVDKVPAEKGSLKITAPGEKSFHSEFKIMVSGNPDVVFRKIHERKNGFSVVELSFGGSLNQVAAVDEQSVGASGLLRFLRNGPGEFEKIRFARRGKICP